MIAVLDASAAVRLVLHPAQAAALSDLVTRAELVVSPQLLAAEVANTWWKYFRAGHLSRAAAEDCLRASLGLVDELVPLEPLSAEALDLAMTAGRTAYDMFYLVLARRQAAVLVTADLALRKDARRLGIALADPPDS